MRNQILSKTLNEKFDTVFEEVAHSEAMEKLARLEETAKRGSTGFNNFTGRDYDMDQMERALLGIPGGGNHAD